MNCAVINLPNRIDRLKRFEKVFYDNFNDDHLFYIEGIIDSKPMIGCNKSHKKAVEFAKKMDFENILIFEDDFDFISDKSKIYFDQANESIPDDYDIALFGYYHLPKPIKENDHWNKINDFCALHCYKVNAKAFDKILNLKEDYHIDRLMGKSNMKKYAINYLPTKQISDLSSISGHITDYDFMLNKFKQI